MSIIRYYTSIYFLILLITVKRLLSILAHSLVALCPFTHLELLTKVRFSVVLPPIDIDTTFNDGQQVLDWVLIRIIDHPGPEASVFDAYLRKFGLSGVG